MIDSVQCFDNKIHKATIDSIALPDSYRTKIFQVSPYMLIEISPCTLRKPYE